MYLLRLALTSLNNRRFTALLTVFAIALSVCLLLAVERIRTETRASFANTISGSDLIVGARSGSVNLLLYSVFRIGNATNNIRWDSFEHFAGHPRVKWAIPLSLGDSHRGYRVLGTSAAYFEHYQYGRNQALQFTEGQQFGDLFEVVLGAEVADALDYKVGQQIVLAHGVSTVSWQQSLRQACQHQLHDLRGGHEHARARDGSQGQQMWVTSLISLVPSPVHE